MTTDAYMNRMEYWSGRKKKESPRSNLPINRPSGTLNTSEAKDVMTRAKPLAANNDDPFGDFEASPLKDLMGEYAKKDPRFAPQMQAFDTELKAMYEEFGDLNLPENTKQKKINQILSKYTNEARVEAVGNQLIKGIEGFMPQQGGMPNGGYL